MKQILVPLDPSDYSKAALKEACKLAQLFDSTVCGIAIIDLEGIEDELRLPFRMDLMPFTRNRGIELVRASREELDQVVSQFRETCDEFKVACRVINTEGQPAIRIVDESRFHDLVVMGLRSHLRFLTEEDGDDVLENVIRHVCSPLLLVPRREIGTVGRVVIAYDGSPPATRALHHFASLGGCWNPEVRIVAAMKADEGLPLLTSAQRYLEGYGYQKVKVDQVDKSIIEAFQDDYVDWADLAVLGSSSKSLFEDLMVGSLPKALILERKIPLLINT